MPEQTPQERLLERIANLETRLDEAELEIIDLKKKVFY